MKSITLIICFLSLLFPEISHSQLKEIKVSVFTGDEIPDYFDDSEVTELFFSRSAMNKDPVHFAFIGRRDGWGQIKINGELVKLNFIKDSKKGKKETVFFSNSTYKLTFSLDYTNVKMDTDNPVAPGSITITRVGFITYSKTIYGDVVLN